MVYMSSGIGLINSHTISQFNKESDFNYMNWGVENGYVSSGNFYMNRHTLSEVDNHNYIYSRNKRDENSPKLSAMEDTGLQNGVDIDVIIPASTLHQYPNMQYNNEYN